MPESKDRMQKITPYQRGQATAGQGEKPEKVRVTADTSKAKFSPGHDPLMQSLSSGIPELPNRYHMGNVIAEIHPKGVDYNPAGEFGHISGKTAKGTHYTPHSSPPGKNPLGSNSNRHGDNPLGHALNKVGTNVLGKPSRRAGQNALPHRDSHQSGKSGYPKFTPKGGGRKP